MYAAEWPCCHDPLRFSPGSEDLLRFARNNPPLQPPARSSSQAQLRVVVVAPELHCTYQHLPRRAKSKRLATAPPLRAQAGRPRPARTPLLRQAPRQMCMALHRPNLVVTFLPLPRGQSHPSNHTRSPLAYSLSHSLTHPPYTQHSTEYCQCVDSCCHTHTPSMSVAQCQEYLE